MSQLNTNTISLSDMATSIPENLRQRCEIWTRVMGYHRPTTEFNAGKKQEQNDRQLFCEPSADELDQHGGHHV